MKRVIRLIMLFIPMLWSFQISYPQILSSPVRYHVSFDRGNKVIIKQ